MNFKSPEQALEEFLASKPSWLRKILQLDVPSRDEQEAWIQSDWWQEGGKVEEEYLRLLQRVPSKWREHRRKVSRIALSTLHSGKPGRPRRDALAAEAKQLQAEGKSPAEIADLLRIKHTVTSRKGLREPTPEGIRKLLSSRKRLPDPDKT